jgi:hypothetical protein
MTERQMTGDDQTDRPNGRRAHREREQEARRRAAADYLRETVGEPPPPPPGGHEPPPEPHRRPPEPHRAPPDPWYGEHGPDPFAGAAPPPPPPRGGARGLDPAALFVLLDAIRRAVPGDLEHRVTQLIREFLLTLRSLIDWYLDRLDRGDDKPEVEDIPID